MASFGFASDGELKRLAEAKKAQNDLLQVMAVKKLAAITTDLQAIKHIVQQGAAESIFSIGDQIIDDWTENVSGTTYSMPHNVVSFDNVTLQDGESIPGMWLQCHYASAFGVQFDAKEAFYYAADGLSAGAYSFTFGSTWGTKIIANTTYYFTLENDVPAGGQLVFDADIYNNSIEGTNVLVYESATATDVSETAEIASRTLTSPTDLGSLTLAGDDTLNLNSIQRAVFGSNRWSQSAIRQYLNSSAGIGEWWTPQNNYDRPPEQLTKYPGFMSGYDSAFLSAIQKVKVTTALNTVTDGGGSEDTYDYFFLPSLEQMYCTPQVSGVEGDYWPYWKRACGSDTTIVQYIAGAFPLIYAINAKSSAQSVRLRSALRGNAQSAWLVSSTGNVYYYDATSVYRFAPACVVC